MPRNYLRCPLDCPPSTFFHHDQAWYIHAKSIHKDHIYTCPVCVKKGNPFPNYDDAESFRSHVLLKEHWHDGDCTQLICFGKEGKKPKWRAGLRRAMAEKRRGWYLGELATDSGRVSNEVFPKEHRRDIEAVLEETAQREVVVVSDGYNSESPESSVLTLSTSGTMERKGTALTGWILSTPDDFVSHSASKHTSALPRSRHVSKHSKLAAPALESTLAPVCESDYTAPTALQQQPALRESLLAPSPAIAGRPLFNPRNPNRSRSKVEPIIFPDSPEVVVINDSDDVEDICESCSKMCLGHGSGTCARARAMDW